MISTATNNPKSLSSPLSPLSKLAGTQTVMKGDLKMGSTTVVLVLVSLLAISPSLAPAVAAQDFLSPLLNETCKLAHCGKGRCQGSLTHAFGFVCECDSGWSQFHVADHLRFLPCVIPNCSLNYSCSNVSSPPAPAPAPSSDSTIFNPCFWSFCGGGSCVKTSNFQHRCDCNDGYINLLNVTSFPFFKDCSIGGDCTKLGISLSNSSSASSPTNVSANNNSSSGDYAASRNFLWVPFLIVSLTMAW